MKSSRRLTIAVEMNEEEARKLKKAIGQFQSLLDPTTMAGQEIVNSGGVDVMLSFANLLTVELRSQ